MKNHCVRLFVDQIPGCSGKPGTSINQLMLNIDQAPTFLNIAGVKVPADRQGTSFLPLLKANAANVPRRKEAYYHYYEFPVPHCEVYPHTSCIRIGTIHAGTLFTGSPTAGNYRI